MGLPCQPVVLVAMFACSSVALFGSCLGAGMHLNQGVQGGGSCAGRLGQHDQQLLRPALARSDQNGQVYRALMQTFHRVIEVT